MCEPETFPVSSFTQTPPRREAEPVAQLGAADERRRRGSRGRRPRRRLVERADESAELVVGEPAAVRDVVGVEQTRGSGRTGSARRRPPGSGSGREVELAPQRRGRRRRRPAFGQRNGYGRPEPGARRSRRTRAGWRRVGHSASSTPVRALNSSISSSQPATALAHRAPEAGCAASKSSSETPCCSTHVK